MAGIFGNVSDNSLFQYTPAALFYPITKLGDTENTSEKEW